MLQIICGCNDGTIKIYKNENLLFEITENTNIVQIAQVGKRLFFINQTCYVKSQ